jgi:hypothetical protein
MLLCRCRGIAFLPKPVTCVNLRQWTSDSQWQAYPKLTLPFEYQIIYSEWNEKANYLQRFAQINDAQWKPFNTHVNCTLLEYCTNGHISQDSENNSILLLDELVILLYCTHISKKLHIAACILKSTHIFTHNSGKGDLSRWKRCWS